MTNPLDLTSEKLALLSAALGFQLSELEGVLSESEIAAIRALREEILEAMEGDEPEDGEDPEDDGQPDSYKERLDFAQDEDFGGYALDDDF